MMIYFDNDIDRNHFDPEKGGFIKSLAHAGQKKTSENACEDP